MVAMISGSPVFGSMGSTTSFLKSTPRTMTATASPKSSAPQSGQPNQCSAISTKKAGSMTNSPWAKFTVCAACQSSVNPIAASA